MQNILNDQKTNSSLLQPNYFSAGKAADQQLLCDVIITPAVEKTLSAGTLFPGTRDTALLVVLKENTLLNASS